MTWNDSMPGMTPVPQSGGGENPASVLEAILGQNSDQLSKLALKAVTPIAGGHATGLPLSMDPTPRVNQPGQLDHRQVVGAGNARGQGIGNAVIGVMNAVAGTKTALDNKKRLEVASATQQLLTAQQAMDQAKIILQTDPNNQAAKDAIEHNTAIMNGVLANDRTRKAIEKGFAIDFTDPQANKTPDHAAVNQGIDMAHKTASYAEQFNEKTPTTMVQNQPAIAQYQAAAQAQKDKIETVRAIVPLLSAQMRVQGQLTAEQLRASQAAALQYTRDTNAMDRLQTQLQGRASLQHSAYLNRLSEIGAEGNKQIQVFKAQLQAKDTDPTSQMKAFTEFDQKSTATIAALSKDIADTMQKKVVLAQTGADKGSQQTLDYAIEQQKAALQTYQNAVRSTKDYYSLQLTGKPYDAGSSTGSNNTDSSTPDPGSATTYDFDDNDEDDLLNGPNTR